MRIKTKTTKKDRIACKKVHRANQTDKRRPLFVGIHADETKRMWMEKKKNSSVEEKSFYELTYTNERNRNTKTLRTNSTQLVSTIFFLSFCCFNFLSEFGICFSFQHFSIYFCKAYGLPTSPSSFLFTTDKHSSNDESHICGPHQWNWNAYSHEKKGFDGKKWMEKSETFFFCQICYLFYLFSWFTV